MSAIWQMFKYGLVGVFNTAVSVAIMYVLSKIGLHYSLYTAIAYIIGICVSFLLNRKYTFGVTNRVGSRFTRFIAVNGLNLVIIQLLQLLLIEGVGLVEWMAVGIGMVSYTLLGFFMTKRFVFRSVPEHS